MSNSETSLVALPAALAASVDAKVVPPNQIAGVSEADLRVKQGQLLAVRLLAFVYMLFFTSLAGMVLWEGQQSDWWTSFNTSDNSVLVGIAYLSGFVSKAMAFMNFLFGFGGGVFAKPSQAESMTSTGFRMALVGLTAVLIIFSLAALWAVADSATAIIKMITGFKADVATPHVSDAISVLGLMNLSMAGGFLVGLAVPGAAALFGATTTAAVANSAVAQPAVIGLDRVHPNPNEGQIPLAE